MKEIWLIWVVTSLAVSICAGPIQGQNYSYEVTLHPARPRKFDIIVYWDRRTWLEADESCTSQGLTLFEGRIRSDDVYFDYISSHIRNMNSTMKDGFWISVIQPPESNEWYKYRPKNCREVPYSPIYVDKNTSHAQCLMLNITAPYGQNIYARKCETRHPYICRRSVGRYTGKPGFYIVHNYTRIVGTIFNNTQILRNVSTWECISKMFNAYAVVAEYWPPDDTSGTADDTYGTCLLHFYPSYLLPLNATAVETGENVYTITATGFELNFAENVERVTASSSEYPCQQVTSTTETDTTQSVSSSYSLSQPTTSPKRCCQTCNATIQSPSPEEIEQQLENLRKELSINKKTITSYTRAKTSAPDSRSSSAAIGTVAIIILVSVTILIIVADFRNLVLAFHNLRKNLTLPV